jgi:hypothetical protein
VPPHAARLELPIEPERNVNQDIAEFKAAEVAEWGDNLLDGILLNCLSKRCDFVSQFFYLFFSSSA